MVPSPSQPEEENPEHASTMENEAAHNITRQEKNSRRFKWSIEEEEMLIKGNSQIRCRFWARVARHFNTYRKMKIEREESQIKSYYYLMMPQINEFNGYYNQIMSNHHSGWSDTQIIQAFVEILNDKREFSYTHVWEMVKDEPKWATQTSDSEAYTSSSHHDQEDNTHEAVLNEIKKKTKDDTLCADYEILMKDTSKMSDQQLIIQNHVFHHQR
uniref:Myb-like domain-containing protein n=1 Tax=Kalanchoe fedtschenkoi TaxID=63787 RepID=A0A7N1A1C9_KALFE